jgi:hypothetical protein
VTGRLRHRGLISGGGRRFSPLQSVQTGSGAHSVPGFLSRGVKQPGREADLSSPFSAEIKNAPPYWYLYLSRPVGSDL